MKTYKIELNEKQLAALSQACEVLARLGIGQWRDAFDKLPLDRDRLDYKHFNTDREVINSIVRKYLKNGVDGYNSSLSIYNEEVSEDAVIAWDMHQVFRKELAWDYAVEKGWVESKEDQRCWSNMFGVDFDDPLHTSKEPLPKIEEKIEKEL